MTGLLGGLLFMGLGLMMVGGLVRGLFGWFFRPRPWFGGWFGRPMMWGGMWRGAFGMGPGMGGMHRAGGPGMGGGPR